MSQTTAPWICGHIDSIDVLGVKGWAGDPNKPEDSLMLDVVIDGRSIGSAVCSAYRDDVRGAGYPAARVGFFVPMPPEFADDNEHHLEVRLHGRLVVRADVHQSVQGPWRQSFRLPSVARLIDFRKRAPEPDSLEPLSFFTRAIEKRGGRRVTAAFGENGSVPTSPEQSAVNGHAIEATPEPPAGQRASDEPADSRHGEMALVAATGLFQADWYLSTYVDIAQAGVDPLTHFCGYGFKDGRRPNPYFDTSWYAGTYGDLGPDENPLVHYILTGEAEGRRPIIYFDPAWYRSTYGLPQSALCLAHYLSHRFTGKYSPIPEFDVAYYAEHYPDVAAAGVDMFEHFVSYGYLESRNPSARFDTRFYRQRYLRDSDESPLPHYLAHRDEPGVYPAIPDHESTIPRQVRRFTQKAAEFEEVLPLPTSAPRKAKLLAYYLPQFHAFEENDRWWGKGFTEWSNVVRALPRFIDHYQPRIPRDLGFYNLDNVETMRRQIELARGAGLYGFVFYFYWFNGHRLMERPLDAFLADRSLDFPICLMWANENWSRRWDGSEREVLISQDYRNDDDLELIDTFARAFSDPRYIRAQGRPLLMLYRPGIIPNAGATIARWRELFRTRANEDPIFVMSQSFGDTDPGKFDLDGAIEFPPHKLVLGLELMNHGLTYLDPEFTAQVYRYDDVIQRSLDEPRPNFPLIKTLSPSWDNDARRQGRGLVMHGSTPAKYQAWLERLIEATADQPFFGERIVCINAWNEWAEGAYLEPDLHFGGAYLNATARAVSGLARPEQSGKLILVGHDAFPGGAQLLLLNIGRVLSRRFGFEIVFILLAGGKLEKDYAELAPVHVAVGNGLARRIGDLKAQGFCNAIVNTCAAGMACRALAQAGVASTLLVHELPRIIEEKALLEPARAGLASARDVVFAAPFVRDRFVELCGDPGAQPRVLIMPQGSYKQVTFSAAARADLRSRLGIRDGQFLALGAGYADLRKGFDLFLQAWRAARRSAAVVHFAWAGDMDPTVKTYFSAEIARAEATGTFHMLGFTDDMAGWHSAADVFVLTSREDPYPTVVLEAISAGTPAVAFDGSGGMPDTIRALNVGRIAELGDVDALTEAVVGMVQDPAWRDARSRLAAIAAEEFSFQRYVGDLSCVAVPGRVRISAMVPNYNYARHFGTRLGTIFAQHYPVHEVVMLDDASSDDSLRVATEVAGEWRRDLRIVANERNSGSVFHQWRRAAEEATGEFVWIAEADDESDPRFLQRLAQALTEAPDAVLVMTDSRAIDSEGNVLWPDHQGYFAEAGASDLARDGIYPAREFARRFLAERNLILNVSCVVWRREGLLAALRACEAELLDYRMAGDWHLYVELMAASEGSVAFVAEPLNVHRRHASSVTHALKATLHVQEIARVQCVLRDRLGDRDGTVRVRQDEYLQQVAIQMGVDAPISAVPETALS